MTDPSGWPAVRGFFLEDEGHQCVFSKVRRCLKDRRHSQEALETDVPHRHPEDACGLAAWRLGENRTLWSALSVSVKQNVRKGPVWKLPKAVRGRGHILPEGLEREAGCAPSPESGGGRQAAAVERRRSPPTPEPAEEGVGQSPPQRETRPRGRDPSGRPPAPPGLSFQPAPPSGPSE